MEESAIECKQLQREKPLQRGEVSQWQGRWSLLHLDHGFLVDVSSTASYWLLWASVSSVIKQNSPHQVVMRIK